MTWLWILWGILFRHRGLLAIAAWPALVACAGWAYRPEGPTDQAMRAGHTELSREIDLNRDGIVSTEEVAYATRKAIESNDWETLIWLGVSTVGSALGAGVMAYKRGQKRGYQQGLYEPIPADAEVEVKVEAKPPSTATT